MPMPAVKTGLARSGSSVPAAARPSGVAAASRVKMKPQHGERSTGHDDGDRHAPPQARGEELQELGVDQAVMTRPPWVGGRVRRPARHPPRGCGSVSGDVVSSK